MEFLNRFSSSVYRMLFLVCSASQRYIIPSLQTLESVVTSFKFIVRFLSVAHLDFLLHLRFHPQLGDFTSLCSPELELCDKKLCSTQISYFSLTAFGSVVVTLSRSLFRNSTFCWNPQSNRVRFIIKKPQQS